MDQKGIGECIGKRLRPCQEKNFKNVFVKKISTNVFKTEKKFYRNSGIAKIFFEQFGLHPFLKMIHKRLRDYDRSPVFSGRFLNLADEHGKVGFKYTADDFGCDGSIPANQPVAKGNDPLLNCRSIRQAMGCSGLPGSSASPTISNWRSAPLASQEFSRI